MIDPGEFTLNLVINLLSNVIYDNVNIKSLPYFERRKIQRRIEDATAEVVEPLIPFLSREGVSEEKQRRLIEICISELQPVVNNSAMLFQGSLSGQRIFEDLYTDSEIPEQIIQDGLKDVYSLLFPRVATLVCKIPEAVKDWEKEAWSENYRRLDDLTNQIRELFETVDSLSSSTSKEADDTLGLIRKALAQKIRFELDLTGLRADRPLSGKFDDLYIHPELLYSPITEGNEPERFTYSGEGSNEPEKFTYSGEQTFEFFSSNHQRNIVIGVPGSGKSTWAKWIQREAMSNHWTGIGLRIELRRLQSVELPSISLLLQDNIGKHLSSEISETKISNWIANNRILFVLDGFDEVRPSERDIFAEWIKDLGIITRGCPIIITSRPLTTNHLADLGENWKRWVFQPFDDKRIKEYIDRWYRYTPLIDGSDRTIDTFSLANGWLEDPTIEPLTGNPLLLSTLLLVHHLDGKLPTGRSQLYHRYVEGMLGIWDDRRQILALESILTLNDKRQIMRSIAIYFFLSEQEQVDEINMFEVVAKTSKALNLSISETDLLATIRERSGLLYQIIMTSSQARSPRDRHSH